MHASFISTDPRRLAALLAREAAHALRDPDGIVKAEEDALGMIAMCVRDEQRAALAELRVWRALYGPGGKLDATHLYEREMNAELALYLERPEDYRAHLARRHARACEAETDGRGLWGACMVEQT